jgi:hypothetical protein
MCLGLSVMLPSRISWEEVCVRVRVLAHEAGSSGLILGVSHFTERNSIERASARYVSSIHLSTTPWHAHTAKALERSYVGTTPARRPSREGATSTVDRLHRLGKVEPNGVRRIRIRKSGEAGALRVQAVPCCAPTL